MATPFPTDLVAAPTGGAIAWVSSNSGVHNILIAEPTPGTGPMAGRTDHKWRAVTTYTGDDGLWITRARLDERREDDRLRARRRREPAGRIAQPGAAAGRHRAGGVRVPRRRRTHQERLGVGSGPVAVTTRPARRVGLARTDLERRSRRRPSTPARLVNARGSASGLAWSPDGSMLAFTSGRGTHSYIGVFTLASKELRYIDPSLDRDGNAGVVTGRIAHRVDPPGRGAAGAHVLAASRSRRTVVAARRRREDRHGDSRCGKRMPATAAPSRASSPTASCIGARGDRLVFPWEKDGWLHLYSVPVGGRHGDAADAGQLRSRVREHHVRTARR